MSFIKYLNYNPIPTSLIHVHTYPYRLFQLKAHAYTSLTHSYTQIHIHDHIHVHTWVKAGQRMDRVRLWAVHLQNRLGRVIIDLLTK